MAGTRRRKIDLYDQKSISTVGWGGLVNVWCICTMHTRGKEGVEKKKLCLNFSCLALKYKFYTIICDFFNEN